MRASWRRAPALERDYLRSDRIFRLGREILISLGFMTTPCESIGCSAAGSRGGFGHSFCVPHEGVELARIVREGPSRGLKDGRPDDRKWLNAFARLVSRRPEAASA